MQHFKPPLGGESPRGEGLCGSHSYAWIACLTVPKHVIPIMIQYEPDHATPPFPTFPTDAYLTPACHFITPTLILNFSLFVLTYNGRSVSSERSRGAWAWRKGCFCVNYVSVCGMVCFYLRHQRYCEPYVFSWFAVCEWVFVGSNMAFLSAIFLDGAHWSVSKRLCMRVARDFAYLPIFRLYGALCAFFSVLLCKFLQAPCEQSAP